MKPGTESAPVRQSCLPNPAAKPGMEPQPNPAPKPGLAPKPWGPATTSLTKASLTASLTVAVLAGGAVLQPLEARAGLLTPLLQLMRPQLEERLARVCVTMASGGDRDLERSLQDPCRQLAGPTSRCLIEETDRSGRSLGVLSDLLGGRFGDDSEIVVKRCMARMFGLPSGVLDAVPLRQLAQRFAERSRQPAPAAGQP
jgi:hypothetical protein